MKIRILSLSLLIVCFLQSHAQNYLLQNKSFIVNKLVQEHAKFRTGQNNYGIQYIDVDETNRGIVSHKAYYFNTNEICIEYDIITEELLYYQEILNTLNTSQNYTRLAQYEWSNYDNSAKIIARIDQAQDGAPVYVIKYTVK